MTVSTKLLAALLFIPIAAACSTKPPVKTPEIHIPLDVAAIKYITPPSHPCNKSTGTNLFCVTGDETHWKCLNPSRVLLRSDDGVRHCILFPPQETETFSGTIPGTITADK
jgi:hypothetical protein